MSEDQDICRLVIHFRDSDEPLEIAVPRNAIIQFHRALNEDGVRFVNIDGMGIPLDRISSYTEEDMEGKSVFASGFLGPLDDRAFWDPATNSEFHGVDRLIPNNPSSADVDWTHKPTTTSGEQPGG